MARFGHVTAKEMRMAWVDLFVIGGGINGTAIARDAAGRGLSVVLAERGDLAGATSSASTKLFHGGLRYLEFFEFRLVREALQERETLLAAMPHISWPMRFVLPLSPEMRFEGETPAGRLLARVLPWMKGRRPAWMIRAGLFLYDHLGGRKILPGTKALDLRRDAAGAALQRRFAKAYEYSDCWVEDSRLVVLTARDAEARGAKILTRCAVTKAERIEGGWHVTTEGGVFEARALVNAAGPWVAEVLREVAGSSAREGVRLVRGSHIVTRRLFDHDRAYFFQGEDGRIIFAIPYEGDFTLIGTTDKDHKGGMPVCTEEERDYLLAFAGRYFERPVTAADVVWSYAGVRPLYDDGASSATAATREYVLTLETSGAPLLNVFGGKITTHRRLAEAAMARLAPHFPQARGDWTAGVALPGGDFPVTGFEAQVAQLRQGRDWLDGPWARRLVRAYGTEAARFVTADRAGMGRDFGASLTEAELVWLRDKEYARSAEDVLWRRSKLGLRISANQAEAVAGFFR